MAIKQVGVIGTGAIGGMISKFLYKEYPEDFYVIGNTLRTERIKKGLRVNGEVIYLKTINCKTEEKKLDAVIVCTKNYDLEDALNDLSSVVDEHTIILPLLNGVNATDKIKKAFPASKVLYGIVMRTDAARIQYDVTFSISGEIQLGYAKNEVYAQETIEMRDYLIRAGISAKIYPDMLHMLWRKWMINIGANQVSVITGAKFKYFGMIKEIEILLRASMGEILDIALAKKINLTKEDLEDVVNILIHYPPEKKTSMLQDIEARRRTEIDSFAGTVMEYGKEYHVKTPVNSMLYYAIKAREKVYLTEKNEGIEYVK